MLTAIMRQSYLHVFAASQGHFGSPQLLDDFLGSVSFFFMGVIGAHGPGLS
jgi:hypothetical protein